MIWLAEAFAAEPSATHVGGDVWMERALVSIGDGRYPDARAQALEAIRSPDAPWRAHLVYLVANERSGLDVVAAAEYEWLQTRDPRAGVVWAWRQVETGQADPGAIAAYGASDAEASRIAGLALAWTSFADQAYDVTRSLIGEVESAEEADLALRVDVATGNWAATAKRLDDARKRFPDHPEVALGLWETVSAAPKPLLKLQTDALVRLVDTRPAAPSDDLAVLYRTRRLLISAGAPTERIAALDERLVRAGEPRPTIARAPWGMRLAMQTGRAIGAHPELASPFPRLSLDERRPLLEAMSAALSDEGKVDQAAKIVAERRAEHDDLDVALLHARLLLDAGAATAARDAAQDAVRFASRGLRTDIGRLGAGRQRQDLADALAILGAASRSDDALRWISLAARLDVAGRWGHARDAIAPASDPMPPTDLFARADQAVTVGDWAKVKQLAEQALDRVCLRSVEGFQQPTTDAELARALRLLARAASASKPASEAASTKDDGLGALPYATIAALMIPNADNLLNAAQLHETDGDRIAAYIEYNLAQRYGATTARDQARTWTGLAEFDVPSAAIGVAWNPSPAANTSRALPKPPRPLEPVPPYELLTSAGALTRDGLKGSVVVLAFFASWCGPCKEELPALDALARRLAADRVPARVIAVSVDQSEADYARFVESSGLRSLTFAWSPETGLDFRVRGIPALWLHDKDGVARMNTVGYDRDGVARIEREVRGLAD
jgi:thiol-disulfide isomerase/thioredoxin